MLALITQVSPDESNLFDWFAPFSLWRWVILAALLALGWVVAFQVSMLSSLALDRPNPPRPKEAFARAAGRLALWAGVAFVLVFAVLCNDLYRRPWTKTFPPPLTPLNAHFPWVAALLAGVGLMFVVRFVLTRR